MAAAKRKVRRRRGTTKRATTRKPTGKKRGRKPTFTEPQVSRVRAIAREEIEAVLRDMFRSAGVKRRSRG